MKTTKSYVVLFEKLTEQTPITCIVSVQTHRFRRVVVATSVRLILAFAMMMVAVTVTVMVPTATSTART